MSYHLTNIYQLETIIKGTLKYITKLLIWLCVFIYVIGKLYVLNMISCIHVCYNFNGRLVAVLSASDSVDACQS